MIHIALVDDNPTDIDIGKQYVQTYFKSRCDAANMEITVSSYMDGPSFLADFRPDDFDLILLDIYMPAMEGTDVAREIRRLDEGVKIIFLTTSREHALEGYKVFASGYILKPVVSHKKELFQALDHALPKGSLKPAVLSAKIPGCETLRVPFSRILYVDCSEGRNASIHLMDKTVNTTNTFQELSAGLAEDPRFFECYHRLMVNMDYIESMEEDSFLLKGNLSVPISRRKKKEVKHHYMQYMLSK
ncbi:LytTR family DNA-binding domain-containing protein [uncultured Dialister sp.]|uniref:LytR/AlgR family response regulator transcription factor n=1 Tax=uncultured Dialister sp. TaxID=278064 RepID=UPI002631D7B0|nr:LytTR family DNA-binding domain-containing protein [uncultured Dialister sp.]